MPKGKKDTEKLPKTRSKKKEIVGDIFEQKPIEKLVDSNYILPESDTNLSENEFVLYDAKKENENKNIDRNLVLGNKEKIQVFDFSKKTFVQLHKANLYSIYSSALIIPANYINNRAFSDTQNLVGNSIVFSNGFIADLDETQVLLEINFNDTEEKNHQSFNGISITKKPIPISRIKKIYVANERVKKDIVSTALTADGGIIPEQFIQPSFPKDLPQIEFQKSNSISSEEYSVNILRFDKILGAFAYLKNYSWLLANKTEQLNTLPLHFFYMANAVSDYAIFQKQKNDKATLFYKQLFGVQNDIEKPFLKWIFSRLNNSKNFTDADTKDFGTIFLSTIQNKDFSLTAKKLLNNLGDSLKRKKTIQEIWQQQDSEKSFLYLFSFLRNYGNANTEDKSTSRRDIPEIITIDPNIGEYVFACLGYFYGYKLLRNFEDKIIINDKTISEYADATRLLPLKFDLSSGLDFAIIESVYQVAFNDNPNTNNFDLITPNTSKRELIRRPAFLPSDYTFTYEEVLGKFIFTIKRKSLTEDAIEQLKKIPDSIPVVSELGIYLLRKGIDKIPINIFEFISHPDRWKYIFSFRRDQVIEALLSNKINPKELIQRIEISKQSKEF